jgi:hypothetical protein
MSLLTIVQNACDRIGLPRPTSVYGASDQTARMMLTLLNQEGVRLSRRHPWQRIVTSHSFSTADGTVAYALPAGFDRLIEGSTWNETQNRPVIGPITPQRWRMLQAQNITATWQAFYVSGNYLRFTPTPSAVETIAFEYVSKYWCASSGDTSADQIAWADDADETFLDEETMTLGLIWRFLRAKGLDYGEAFQTYEVEVNNRMANDGGMRIMDMSSEPGTGVFAPFIEDGNWSIT